MGILLTPEETKQNSFRISTCPDPELVFTQDDGSYSKNYFFVGKDLLKAQAIKVLDELDKPCPHGLTQQGYFRSFGMRKYCAYCMAEIRKELTDGTKT